MKKYYILAVAAIALAACNNDDNYIDEPVAAQITATIGRSVVSRVSDTSWADGDKIGITTGAGKYVNVLYQYNADEGGKFTGNQIYFKNKREPEDFYAYYPYTGTEGAVPEEPIEASTDASNQTPENLPGIDFLYAEVKGAVAADNPTVDFSFDHKMSRITFTFINGNNGANVSLMTSYKIEGLVMAGTFNPKSGVCLASDAAPVDLKMDVSGVQSGVAVNSLILFPQSVAEKEVMLRVSDSEGGKYFCELSFENDRLEPGNHYQYTIIVNKTEMIVGKSSITPWVVRDETFDATIDK